MFPKWNGLDQAPIRELIPIRISKAFRLKAVIPLQNLNSRGVAELSFYCCRLVINAICIVCIQSLYTQWRQEKSVMKRLEDLNIVSRFCRA